MTSFMFLCPNLSENHLKQAQYQAQHLTTKNNVEEYK